MRNRSSTRFISALAALTFFVLFVTPAFSLVISPSVGGLTLADGCSDPTCFFNIVFSPPPTADPSPMTGTFDITGTTLTFSIDLTGPATLVGNDGAVTSVDFTNVNYSGTFSLVSGVAGLTFTDQSASITGTLTPNGGGSPVAFNLSNVNTTGNCLNGATVTCGFQFGAGVGFAIDVNGNQRYFNHRVDIFSVIPEPGTALLLGLGLSGLAIRRRPN